MKTERRYEFSNVFNIKNYHDGSLVPWTTEVPGPAASLDDVCLVIENTDADSD